MKQLETCLLSFNREWRLVHKPGKGFRVQWRKNGRWTNWPGAKWFQYYAPAVLVYDGVKAARVGAT